MWWHADDRKYSLLLQGLATSDNIAGPYTFQKAVAPFGNWSQDFGLFTDYKDGRSYALYSNGDRVEGRDVYVSRFNQNVTDLEEVVYRFPKFDLEAPTILQTENSYWALMSHKTGYRPNSMYIEDIFRSLPLAALANGLEKMSSRSRPLRLRARGQCPSWLPPLTRARSAPSLDSLCGYRVARKPPICTWEIRFVLGSRDESAR
jgi:hypothetical protein